MRLLRARLTVQLAWTGDESNESRRRHRRVDVHRRPVYAQFAGADFGSGIWDLLAAEGKHAAALRTQTNRSIGPVWKANHL